MAWNKYKVRNPELRKELDAVFTGKSPVGIAVETQTPVNAVAGSYKITALEFALLNNGDIINLDEDHQFSKVASGATGDQFENLAGLVSLVDALDDFDGASTDGDTTCTISYSTKGIIGNNREVHISIVSDTTAAFNDGVTASFATIPEADLDEIDDGDDVIFAGNTFTKVASDPGDNEFEDKTGLIALLDALDDWGAEAAGQDVKITYKNNTEDMDGEDVVINYYRKTSGGVDGTVAIRGKTVADSDYLYITVDDNTTAGDNWRRVTLGSAY